MTRFESNEYREGKSRGEKALAKQKVTYTVANSEITLTPTSVRNFLVQGKNRRAVTDEEVVMFMSLCKYQKLNPFNKEAYLIKYSETRPASLVVSKSAYMRIANENPNYDGIKSGIIVIREGEIVYQKGAFSLPTDVIVGGWAEVYIKNRSIPLEHTVSFKEFDKNNDIWKEKPGTMIRKTAIAQALKEAFPISTGFNMADEEEEVTVVPNDAEEPKQDLEELEVIDGDFEDEVTMEEPGF